jgi:hypothetical protein
MVKQGAAHQKEAPKHCTCPSFELSEGKKHFPRKWLSYFVLYLDHKRRHSYQGHCNLRRIPASRSSVRTRRDRIKVAGHVSFSSLLAAPTTASRLASTCTAASQTASWPAAPPMRWRTNSRKTYTARRPPSPTQHVRCRSSEAEMLGGARTASFLEPSLVAGDRMHAVPDIPGDGGWTRTCMGRALPSAPVNHACVWTKWPKWTEVFR